MIFTQISIDKKLENPIIVLPFPTTKLQNNNYCLENSITGCKLILYTYVFHQDKLPDASPRIYLPSHVYNILFGDRKTHLFLRLSPINTVKSRENTFECYLNCKLGTSESELSSKKLLTKIITTTPSNNLN